MKHYSLLDLSPIPEGQTAADALAATVDLARAAERAGYHRYWLAEHHNMPGVASAATAILIAMWRDRRGRSGSSGGIMLPNHAPLVVAEQFGTLATLYPGRIDLALGRAPGTDVATALALRRHMASEDSFPRDVQELIGYLGEGSDASAVRAIPGVGPMSRCGFLGSISMARNWPLIWVCLCLRLAFRTAIVGAGTGGLSQHLPAIGSAGETTCDDGCGRCAAESDAEAARTCDPRNFWHSRASCRGGPASCRARPMTSIRKSHRRIMAQVRQAMSCSAIGSAETVRGQLGALIDTFQPDELMITA